MRRNNDATYNLNILRRTPASVAISNKLTIISNDKAYDEAEVKRISFKEFLNLIEKQ